MAARDREVKPNRLWVGDAAIETGDDQPLWLAMRRVLGAARKQVGEAAASGGHHYQSVLHAKPLYITCLHRTYDHLAAAPGKLFQQSRAVDPHIHDITRLFERAGDLERLLAANIDREAPQIGRGRIPKIHTQPPLTFARGREARDDVVQPFAKKL